MEARIARLKQQKEATEKETVRQKVIALVRGHGFELWQLFGRGSRGNRTIAAKYRDPDNPSNTWAGRGRMPRWLADKTQGVRTKIKDYRIN